MWWSLKIDRRCLFVTYPVLGFPEFFLWKFWTEVVEPTHWRLRCPCVELRVSEQEKWCQHSKRSCLQSQHQFWRDICTKRYIRHKMGGRSVAGYNHVGRCAGFHYPKQKIVTLNTTESSGLFVPLALLCRQKEWKTRYGHRELWSQLQDSRWQDLREKGQSIGQFRVTEPICA